MCSEIKSSLPSIAVFISGEGTLLQAIMDHIKQGSLHASVALVVSSSSKAKGLMRAKAMEIETLAIVGQSGETKETYSGRLIDALQDRAFDLIVFSGFMKLVTHSFINHFHRKIINIHPSLLPEYKGLDTHRRAIADGASFAGTSIHWVNEHLDDGLLIAQAKCLVYANDTPETLKKRVQEMERALYPCVIGWVLAELNKGKLA